MSREIGITNLGPIWNDDEHCFNEGKRYAVGIAMPFHIFFPWSAFVFLAEWTVNVASVYNGDELFFRHKYFKTLGETLCGLVYLLVSEFTS